MFLDSRSWVLYLLLIRHFVPGSRSWILCLLLKGRFVLGRLFLGVLFLNVLFLDPRPWIIISAVVG
jgi:hypothetical protein